MFLIPKDNKESVNLIYHLSVINIRLKKIYTKKYFELI